jgi:CRP/FNR family transcriptional regulator, cyclic AMP receptor protein
MDATDAKTLTTGWLAQADPELGRELLGAGRLRHFVDGAMIYGFQQEQVCLWGVVSGSVRIFVTMNEQDPKLAHCAGPGFWFGEIPVITGWARAVQVMAFGDLRLCAIDRSVVTGIARRNPEVWRVVATLSVMNQMTAIGAGEDLMIRDSTKRLVAVLLRLAGHRNGFQRAAALPAVPVTQLEIAEASSLSRSSATRILGDLARQGFIRTDYRTIAILDPDALKALLAT